MEIPQPKKCSRCEDRDAIHFPEEAKPDGFCGHCFVRWEIHRTIEGKIFDANSFQVGIDFGFKPDRCIIIPIDEVEVDDDKG